MSEETDHVSPHSLGAGGATPAGGSAEIAPTRPLGGLPPPPPLASTRPPAPLFEPAVEELLRRQAEQMTVLTQSLGRLLEAFLAARVEPVGCAGQRESSQPVAYHDASTQVGVDSEVDCNNFRWKNAAPEIRKGPVHPYWVGRCFCCRRKGHSVFECPLLEFAPPPSENDGR